jgi:hypothetical protein
MNCRQSKRGATLWNRAATLAQFGYALFKRRPAGERVTFFGD